MEFDGETSALASKETECHCYYSDFVHIILVDHQVLKITTVSKDLR